MSEFFYKVGIIYFGFCDVVVKDKQKLVGQVFILVVCNYDLMNDLMSLGVYWVWKCYYVVIVQVKLGDCVFDLVGGIGDIVVLLKECVGVEGLVVLGDINVGMLLVGCDCLINRGLVFGLDYVQCNVEVLLFLDNSFDLVIIVFGLCNVIDKDVGLCEMYCVLKVGGQVCVLEFFEVIVDWFKLIYDFYLFKILFRLGKLFVNDLDSYQYLVESICKYLLQDELKVMMGQVGFECCYYKNLIGGIVLIYFGYKL